MNLKKIALFTLFSAALFARSNYCIQVAEVYHFDEYNIPSRMQSVIEDFDKARIDKRGRHYILRVGDYKSYSKAKKVLRKIKARRFRDAFVRRCDYIKSKIAYPKIDQEENYKESSYTPVKQALVQKAPKKQPLPIIEKPIEKSVEGEISGQKDPFAAFEDTQTNGYEYKGEQKYSYDFWKECKRCYAPLEDEKNYVSQKKNTHVMRKGDVIEKENFFQKHSQGTKQEVPQLHPSDTFFGDSRNRDTLVTKQRDNKSIEEENIIVEAQPEVHKARDLKQEPQEGDDFFAGFEEIETQEAMPPPQEKRKIIRKIEPQEEVLEPIVEEMPQVEENDVKKQTKDDDVYDMFGIDDL